MSDKAFTELDDFLDYILFDKKGIPRKRPDIMLCILKVCLRNNKTESNKNKTDWDKDTSRFNKAKKKFVDYKNIFQKTNSKKVDGFNDNDLKVFMQEVKKNFFTSEHVKTINNAVAANSDRKSNAKKIVEKIGKSNISPKMKAITTEKFTDYIVAYNLRLIKEDVSKETIAPFLPSIATTKLLQNSKKANKINEKREARQARLSKTGTKGALGRFGHKLAKGGKAIKKGAKWVFSSEYRKELKEKESNRKTDLNNQQQAYENAYKTNQYDEVAFDNSKFNETVEQTGVDLTSTITPAKQPKNTVEETVLEPMNKTENGTVINPDQAKAKAEKKAKKEDKKKSRSKKQKLKKKPRKKRKKKSRPEKQLKRSASKKKPQDKPRKKRKKKS